VCCSVLRCVAVPCSVLQCIAACCTVLQTYLQREHARREELQSSSFSMLLCFAVHCSALQCAAVCCSVLQKYLQREHLPLEELQSNSYNPQAAFHSAAAIPKSLKNQFAVKFTMYTSDYSDFSVTLPLRRHPKKIPKCHLCSH